MDDRIATCKQALQTAIASGSDHALQTAYTDLGQAFFQRQQLPQALHCYEKLLRSTQSTAIPFKDMNEWDQKENLAAQGIAYCHIGLIYLVMAEYPKVAQPTSPRVQWFRGRPTGGTCLRADPSAHSQ